ncbi:MAG: stage II sporulation protein M [Bacteroidota bacterium]
MRETNFIEQNKKKWKDFERVLDGQYEDPEKLNELFIQVTDDLSYSRTYYPNRSVRVYLNGLAQKVFFSIYKSKKSHLKKIVTFWTEELPQINYLARKEFRLSLIIFLLSMGIGVFSSMMDPEFASVILGEPYIEMTVENIENGDPMAVYKERGAFGMSFGITFNNLFVAFLSFIAGALYAVGSVVIMISNGIMVGTFQYFFIERDLFWESFLTIWIHGTLEISCIIIAGAAGITMGKGLLFPGTYTRLQAFQRSSRRGLKIMIGITPLIILAGFIEGYLTRFTETPDWIRGLFIFLCLAFILLYFVVYPIVLARRGFKNPIKDAKLPPSENAKIATDSIKSSGDILADIFKLFRTSYSWIFPTALITTSIFCALTFLLFGDKPTDLFYFPSYTFGSLSSIDQFFNNSAWPMPFLPIINLIAFSILTIVGQHILIRAVNKSTKLNVRSGLKFFLTLLPAMVLLQFIFWTDDWYTPFIIVFAAPFMLLFMFIIQVEKGQLGPSFHRSTFLMSGNYGRTLGLFIIMSLLVMFFFFILDTSLFQFFLNYISWVVYLDESNMADFSIIFLTFLNIFMIHLSYLFIVCGIGIQYYTLKEIKEANHLKEKIENIGSSKKIFGIERE